MRKNRGLTLLELIAAISIMGLVVLASGGIYISGWKMFRNSQRITQAQFNAVAPALHIAKHLMTATKVARVIDGIDFNYFTDLAVDTGSFTTHQYRYNSGADTLSYTNGHTGTAEIIGRNITSFSTTHLDSQMAGDDIVYANELSVLTFTIRAADNSGTESYTLTYSIAPRLQAMPNPT